MFLWSRATNPNRGRATTTHRHDTQALVVELKKERRTALVWGAIGVLIAAFLVFFFFTGDGEGPSTPTGRAASQYLEDPPGMPGPALLGPSALPPGLTTPGPGAVGDAAKTPAPSEPAKPVLVRVMVAKKALLFVDGKTVPRAKDTPLELSPGAHEVRLKIGKKSVTAKIEVSANNEYELRFDPKNERVVLKKVK
ncbi:MAG: hypothetical protein HY903_14055 [Deltaproteobacteria bacterium]|nr:hypothetical protein [Deltaproteobacteria bacterium]